MNLRIPHSRIVKKLANNYMIGATMNDVLPVIAILGGTGDLGTGLASRWIQAGYPIVLGSRSLEKSETAVSNIKKSMQADDVDRVTLYAMDNTKAAEHADIVAITVPFSHQASILESVKPMLQGKILIDVTVPLVPPKVARVQMPDQGSAGEIAQKLLGDEVKVVSAFQNVAAHHLRGGEELSCDVLVCGNDKDARGQVIELVEAAGMRGFHAGAINNAAAVEAMASVLIFINKQYKCHAGIRITGPED